MDSILVLQRPEERFAKSPTCNSRRTVVLGSESLLAQALELSWWNTVYDGSVLDSRKLQKDLVIIVLLVMQHKFCSYNCKIVHVL